MRAFRRAEVFRWCARQTRLEINAAREQCHDIGGASCDACTELVLPRLRNACDPNSYALAPNSVDRRSICDIALAGTEYEGRALILYRPYNASAPPDALRAARELCELGPQAAPRSPSYFHLSETPPDESDASSFPEPADPSPLTSWSEALCGSLAPQAYWYRFTHGAPDPEDPHAHVIEVKTEEIYDYSFVMPVDRVEFTLHRACSLDPAMAETASSVDTDADGTPDTLRITWSAIEGDVCLRVQPKDPNAQTGFTIDWSGRS